MNCQSCGSTSFVAIGDIFCEPCLIRGSESEDDSDGEPGRN